jgi:YaiO family outer membrane protein
MKLRTILSICIVLLHLGVYAQRDTDTVLSQEPDTTVLASIPKDADSAFAMARELAYKSSYQKSRVILDFLTRKYPAYRDIPAFKARTYLYEKDYPEAARLSKAIIARDTGESYEEPRHILLLAKRYNDQLDTALFLAERGLKRDKSSEFYNVEKAQILRAQKEFKDALSAADTGLAYHPDNNELQQLRSFILNLIIFDGIAVGADYDYFTQFSSRYQPWKSAFLQVGTATKSGTYIGRVNYADRNGRTGFQLEGDAYPIIGEGKYLYFNLGVSNSDAFPTIKGAAEYFTALPWSFEGSLGIRYFNFKDIEVLAYTGSLGYYWQRNYLQYRLFVIQETLGYGFSNNFLFRHYAKGSPDFVQLIGGFGYTLDQRIISIQGNLFRNTYYAQSRYLGIAYRKIFTSKLYGQAGFTLTSQEDPRIRDSFYRIYSFSLMLGHRF